MIVNTKQRNSTLDVLKLVMAFMIVGIHSQFLDDMNSLAEYITVNGIFRLAVPIFLLINGFYFYQVLSSEKMYAWLKRAIYMYVFWMVFYSYFWFRPDALTFLEAAKIAQQIVMGYHHLWYISGMISAAILLYFFRDLSASKLIALVIITITIGLVIQYAGNYHIFGTSIVDALFNKHWVHRNFLFFAFPYLCMGFLIKKFDAHEEIQNKYVWLSAIIGVTLLISESYINYSSSMREGGFDNFLSLFIAAPAVFVLAIKSKTKYNTKNVALYATSVYFIHPLILSTFGKFDNFDLGRVMLTVMVILMSLIVSSLFVLASKRVKFIL